MATFVQADSNLDAWKQGAIQVLENRELYNLVTEIADPASFEANWFKEYNPAAFTPDIQSLSDVTNTIFPYKYLTRGYSRQQLCAQYMTVHERAKKIHRQQKRWGTYFERMICFGDHDINQLERVIHALQTWTNNSKAALLMHTSSADTDKPRPIGGPCLQYVEFLCPDENTVSLLAVYRNHDYFEKVLGNFIGLGQLLKFVCIESNRNPGSLICHSAHAYFHSTKSKLKELARL
jgi:thymidylate synthase